MKPTLAVESIRVESVPREFLALGYEPMSLRRDQIAALRGLLYQLEANKPMDAETRREHTAALRRTLLELETGNPDSPLWWACGALKKSVRKVTPTRYVVHDIPLYSWAMQQISELVPDGEDAGNAH
jgi:hypothetical protein